MPDVAEKLARYRRFRNTDLPRNGWIATLVKAIKSLDVFFFKTLEVFKIYHPQKSIVGIPTIATRNFANLQAVVYNGTVGEVLGFRPRRWFYRLFKGVPDVEMFERVQFQVKYNQQVRTVEASTESRGFIQLQLPWNLPWKAPRHTEVNIRSRGVETLLGTVHLGLYEIHTPKIYCLSDEVKWVVVSDIDDTIKNTNIAESTSFKSVVKSVFRGHYYTYEPIHGMPELYQELVNKGALIVYLTSTPYQLSPFLLKFLSDCKFPEGPVFPRWMGYGKRRHKWRTMHRILSGMDRQKCFLVGDSGEMDMDIYRRVCENPTYSHKVEKILIRQIPGTSTLKTNSEKEVVYHSNDQLREALSPILNS